MTDDEIRVVQYRRLMREQADEIERLRAELEELKRVRRRRIDDFAPPRFTDDAARGDNNE